MFSISPVKASKDLTRFMLTCGAGITGNGASCMSLCRSAWAFFTSCCACSKSWASSMASCAFSPASTTQRNLARASSILWPMGSSLPPPSSPCTPKCGCNLRGVRAPLPAPAAAESAQELGPVPSRCQQDAQPLQRSSRRRSAAAKAQSDPSRRHTNPSATLSLLHTPGSCFC